MKWIMVVAAMAALTVSRESVLAAGTVPPLRVETRAIPGRDVKQVTAEGIVDAPPHVVRAVLTDLEWYPRFMPYVKQSRVLSREASGDVLNYQRLSFGFPWVRDRHYVIRIAEREYHLADRRRAWALVWRLEDGLPPGVSPDAVRVAANSGHWDLRPAASSGSMTEVRYCVFTDPAGALPKWLVRRASTEGIPQLFAAVSAAAMSPRYASVQPPSEQAASAENPSLGDCSDPSLTFL